MAILNSVLVVAPTGKVGLAICHELGKTKSSFKRIAAFNNTSRGGDDTKEKILSGLRDLGLEIVSGTYEDVDIFRGFDVVIMPLGNHGLYLQPQIIDTAIAAGVRHFYPSEFGADLLVGDNWHQRYYKYKAIAREHLTAHSKDTKGLGWTFIEVGRFTEWSVIKHFGIDNANHKATIYGNENGRQSLLSVEELVGLHIWSKSWLTKFQALLRTLCIPFRNLSTSRLLPHASALTASTAVRTRGARYSQPSNVLLDTRMK